MTAAPARTGSDLVTPVLVGGCIIVLVSFGIRATFGLFQLPIATEFGWPRAEFSLAIAVQNLAWGIGAPLFGALAERYGDRLAILAGMAAYIAGLVLSTLAATPLAHQMLEFVVGLGIAGTGLGVVLAVVGRAASDRNRSMALAIVTAAGSAGQIVFPPLTQALLARLHWGEVFLVFAVAIAALALVLPLLRAPPRPARAELAESLRSALLRAVRDPSYTMIFLGFFACGFHLGFLTAHFPALVAETCGPIDPAGLLAGIGLGTTAALGAASLAVIGVFNIAGTLAAGWLGRTWQRKTLLAIIYAARAAAGAVFILLPVTPESVLAFAVVSGLLWLATVPLTSGLVAHLYGLRYMGTLYGFVFLSHQIGSFLGIWLGGALYDRYGTYDAVWWIAIAVGVFAALVHLPVAERRPAAGAAA